LKSRREASGRINPIKFTQFIKETEDKEASVTPPIPVITPVIEKGS